MKLITISVLMLLTLSVFAFGAEPNFKATVEPRSMVFTEKAVTNVQLTDELVTKGDYVSGKFVLKFETVPTSACTVTGIDFAGNPITNVLGTYYVSPYWVNQNTDQTVSLSEAYRISDFDEPASGFISVSFSNYPTSIIPDSWAGDYVYPYGDLYVCKNGVFVEDTYEKSTHGANIFEFKIPSVTCDLEVTGEECQDKYTMMRTWQTESCGVTTDILRREGYVCEDDVWVRDENPESEQYSNGDTFCGASGNVVMKYSGGAFVFDEVCPLGCRTLTSTSAECKEEQIGTAPGSSNDVAVGDECTVDMPDLCLDCVDGVYVLDVDCAKSESFLKKVGEGETVWSKLFDFENGYGVWSVSVLAVMLLSIFGSILFVKKKKGGRRK